MRTLCATALLYLQLAVGGPVVILAAAGGASDFAARLAAQKPAIEERSVRANVVAALPVVLKWAHLFDIPAAMLMAMIDAESTFKPRAISKYGAIGYGQHMPREIEGWLERLWDWAPKGTRVYTEAKKTAKKWTGEAASLFDIDLNVMLLAWHMRYLLDEFKTTDTAILAYKAGETAMRRRIRTKAPLATGEGAYYLARVRRFEPTYELLIARKIVA